MLKMARKMGGLVCGGVGVGGGLNTTEGAQNTIIILTHKVKNKITKKKLNNRRHKT